MEQTLQIWTVDKGYAWICQGRLASNPDMIFQADAAYEIVQIVFYHKPELLDPGSKLTIEMIEKPKEGQ